MKKLLLIFFLIGYVAYSQSLSLFDIDPSGFPTISAKVNAFNAKGEQLYNLNLSDFKLYEDGSQKAIKSFICPQKKEPVNVSVAMSIDVSGSMRGDKTGVIPVEFGKRTASKLVELINAPKIEFALQICDAWARLVQDFTPDKTLMQQKIAPITAQGDNNFVEHLLNPLTGILNIAKYGRYKKAAILYTDAWWHPLTNEELQRCIDTCSKYNIQFYTIIYTRSEAEPNGIKKSLNALANATGGKMYDGITSENAAESIANDLQVSIQANSPCTIEWVSQPICEIQTRSVELYWNGLTSIGNYNVPFNGIATITLNPVILKFGNLPPGSKTSQTIDIKAENTDITVKNVNLKYGTSAYLIKNATFPFLIPKGTIKQIEVEYAPLDSNVNYAVFEIETDYCNTSFSVTGGFPGKPLSGKTLKLIHPNGGEEFVVGSDTLISWQGVSESDIVTLKFSNDNGATWSVITDNASKLKFPWKNVPGPTSNICLAEVIFGTEGVTPKIEWERSYGGSDRDNATIIQQTIEGGYIFTGNSYSRNGDVIGNHGIAGDIWVVKTNELGIKDWAVCLGGNNFETPTNLLQTGDGGYIISGYTFSSDGYVTNNHGDTDYWVVKLNSSGKIDWQNCYGGSNFDYCFLLQEVKTGGYILGGITSSNDGNVTGYKNSDDIWIVKINSIGVIEWQKCMGGTKFENIHSIVQTFDGGFLVGGYTESNDQDAVGNKGNWDYWVAKLSKNGNLDWKKCFGGSMSEYSYKMIASQDGGFVIGGESSSKDGDVTINHANSDDVWVVKFDNNGNILWEKSLGGSDKEHFKDIHQTSDNGFIILSETYSDDGDINGYHKNNDVWVSKISKQGTFEWGTCLGGNSRESVSSSVMTYDDGIVLSISTNSIDGDVTGNHGGYDIWLVKINKSGNVEWKKTLGGTKDDYGTSIKQTIDGGYVVAGSTNSNNGDITKALGDNDYWIIKLSSEGYSQKDASDNVFSIVEPKISAIDLDMQKCIVGSMKDTIIFNFVENVGSYLVRIDTIIITDADSDCFIMTAGLPKYQLIPKEQKTAEMLFIPNRIGKHNAKISIKSQSETVTINITGEGIAPSIQLSSKLLDFGLVPVGNQRTMNDTALIKNISSNPVFIKDVVMFGPDKDQFLILNGGGPFNLQPNESRKLNIQFKPLRNGRTSGEIGFLFDDIGSPAVTQLFGKGISGLIYMVDDSSYVGEERILQLGLANIIPDSLAKIASDFTAKIRFQNSILTLKNLADFAFVNDSIIVNLQGKISSSNILAEIPVIAGLGNVEETTLDIIDFKLLDNLGNIVNYEFEKYSGTFKLLGICKDGGTRLINPSGKAGIQSIAPNPAGNSIDLEFITSEIGYTEIAIYNTLGEKVMTAFSEDISLTGKRNIKLNSSEIGNGTYMVIFKSPTVVDTRQIMIVK